MKQSWCSSCRAWKVLPGQRLGPPPAQWLAGVIHPDSRGAEPGEPDITFSIGPAKESGNLTALASISIWDQDMNEVLAVMTDHAREMYDHLKIGRIAQAALLPDTEPLTWSEVLRREQAQRCLEGEG